jgi:hypothetical protein
MIAGVAGRSDHAWNATEVVIWMNDRAKSFVSAKLLYGSSGIFPPGGRFK